MAPTNAELVQRNEEYATTHNPMPTIDDIVAMGGGPPKTAIITCVDPRVFPEKLLGLKVGETFIFRTVAGHPQPALQDLATLDIQGGGTVEDVMIIYHTDCGSLRFEAPRIRAGYEMRDPAYEGKVGEMTFGAVDRGDVDRYIREDVEWLRNQPLLRSGKGIDVQGYLFDLKIGKLRQVT